MSGLGQGRFSPEQWAAITHRGSELAVSAAAGSGKTSVLVERICHLLLGVQPDGQADPGRASDASRLLVVTFTVKAAAEMRDRLAQRLAELAGDSALSPAAQRWAQRQLLLLPGMRLGTIHSFCSAVIRQYGAVHDVPQGRLLDEAEGQLLEHRISTDFLDQRLGGAHPDVTALALAYGGPDGVGGDDLSFSGAGRAGGLRPLLLGLCRFRRSLSDPEQWHVARGYTQLDPARYDPIHPLVLALRSELEEWVEAQSAAAQSESLALQADMPQAQHLVLLAERQRALRAIRDAADWKSTARALDCLVSAKLDGNGGLPSLPYKPGLLSVYRRDIEKADPWYDRLGGNGIEAVRDQARDWLELFSEPWSAVARRENAAAQHTATLWRLAADYEAEYGRYKAGRGLRDFADLERDCYNLLRDERVAAALRSQLDEVLVDEYQDTNELQEAILSLITPRPAGRRARFAVGDLKQSIYGFRLAEPELFQQLCLRLEDETVAGRHLRLNANYRSRRSVVSAVNEVFTGLMSPEFGGEDYALAALEFASSDYPAGAEPQPEAHLQLVSTDPPVMTAGNTVADEVSPESDPEAAEAERDQTHPALQRAVAETLQRIHASGAEVYDKGERCLRPVQWRDMAVLLRSRSGITDLRGALSAAGIPFTAEGRSGFYERPEIADILSLLAVIDNPLQDVPLAAVLHGPVGRLTPGELLEVARALQQADDLPDEDDAERIISQGPWLWRRLQAHIARAEAGNPLAARLREIVAQVAAWRSLSRELALPDFIWRLYREAGLLVASASFEGGQQRIANLLAFHDLALKFSGFEQQGLAGFLEFVRQHQRAAGDLGEADLLASDADQVRILTIHQAKGLEFPVVVMPLQSKFNLQALNADVLWHKSAGLGAAYVNLVALADEPARRWQTLAYRHIRNASRRTALEEELRVLYVGLTRARERLEVLLPLGARQLAANDPVPPAQATMPWHWLGGQLAHYIEGQATAEQYWSVEVREASPQVEEHQRAPVQPQPAAHVDMGAIQLARAEYSGLPDAPPFKLTVSDLAKRQQRLTGFDDQEESAEWFTILAGELAQVGPQSVNLQDSPPRPDMLLAGAAAPDARLRGTLAHAALQSLVRIGRFCADCAATDVAAAYALAARRLGLPADSIPDEAGLERLALGMARLSTQLQLGTARLYSEVPLSADLTAAELDGLGLKHPALPAGDPRPVVVQGTLDLLIQYPAGDALILDFKTDRVDNPAELVRRYTAQLELYAELTRRLLPGIPVRWALYGVGTVGLVEPGAAIFV